VDITLIMAATYEVFPCLAQSGIENNTVPVSETLARHTPPEMPCTSLIYRQNYSIKGQGEIRMTDRFVTKGFADYAIE
jgi:hypothetical protein